MINQLSDTPETHIASHVLHINNTLEMCRAWEAFRMQILIVPQACPDASPANANTKTIQTTYLPKNIF